MSAILLLGFLLGMRHALEADHLAAVATLATGSRSAWHALRQGAAWGLGHTITLLLACSVALFLDAFIPERLAQLLEGAVGAMLIALGADVLWRMRRDRVHLHTHHHRDGTEHLHAHSHGAGADAADHEHAHRHGFPARALCVGLMHGLAGSAALILITLGTVTSKTTGLLYVALFGVGSILGMAVLSLAISVPLRKTRGLTRLHQALQGIVGLTTIAIGSLLLVENAWAAA